MQILSRLGSSVRWNDVVGVVTLALNIQHYIFCVKTEACLIDEELKIKIGL